MNDLCWLKRRICENLCSIISVAFNGIVISIIIGALFIWSDWKILQMFWNQNTVFEDLCEQIALTAVIIGISFALLIRIFRSSLSRNTSEPEKIESLSPSTVVVLPSEGKTSVNTLIKIVAPVSATLFFLYQILAGSLFATTTVTVKGERCNKAGKLLVTATIERGDNWLAAIAVDQYMLSSSDEDKEFKATDAWKFPRKSDKLLRLAPHEKTSTQFILKAQDVLPAGNINSDIFLTMSVRSYAIFWPIPSESLARAVIPAIMPVAEHKIQKKQPAEDKKESVCENKDKNPD